MIFNPSAISNRLKVNYFTHDIVTLRICYKFPKKENEHLHKNVHIRPTFANI